MPTPATVPNGISKHMKKLVFAVAGATALMLSACHNNNQDAVDNAQLNQPGEDLNELANQAAMDAANMEAENLAAQQNKLQSENAAAADNATNPAEADEQNVSGM
jgi:hypothetical protein